MNEIKDRCMGALVGLAVGDAVGTTLEFKAPGSFEPITDMVGGGPFNLEPGQWTDDTSMALCLADSLLDEYGGGFNPVDQMERYAYWAGVMLAPLDMEEPRASGPYSSKGYCFDIGGTVRGALSRFRSTGNPFSGSTDPHSSGNGCIMRLAPVPMFYHRNGILAVRYSGLSSLTTHGSSACLDCCHILGDLLWRLISGQNRERVITAGHNVERHDPVRRILQLRFRVATPPDIKGTGYVVDCLEAALWAFYTTYDFRSCVLAAANLGDDADTTAAVAGQLAGAHYGLSGIPTEWVDRLYDRDRILNVASRLYDAGLE